MKTIGVILASGIGNRFGSDVPKQFYKVDDKMIISFVVESLKNSRIDDIVVVCGNEYYRSMIEEMYNLKAILGGNTRNESVNNALEYSRKNGFDNIIFCDSVRPNLKSEYVNECIDLLNDYDAVITTQKITDSLGSIGKVNLNRENYFLIQTPECFKIKALDNFDINSSCTAIVQQLDESCKVYNNFNLKNNIKITYKEDIRVLKSILE